VEVSANGATGSGTIIAHKGDMLVLTAAHVVADCVKPKTVKYRDVNGVEYTKIEQQYLPVTVSQSSKAGTRTWRCKIVLYSPIEEEGGHDLALLLPEKAEGMHAAFRSQAPLEPGQDCWYIGTTLGLHRSLEKSIINRVEFEWEGNPFYVVNGNGSFGNSGGGLFVRHANKYILVGVVVRIWRGHATPLMCQTQETIAAFLEEYKK